LLLAQGVEDICFEIVDLLLDSFQLNGGIGNGNLPYTITEFFNFKQAAAINIELFEDLGRIAHTKNVIQQGFVILRHGHHLFQRDLSRCIIV